MTNKTETKLTRQGSTKNLLVSVRFSTVEELEKVEVKAAACGYKTVKQSGVSGYLKKLASEHAPKSVYDHQVMQEVCNLHARLGQSGALFKIAMQVEWTTEMKVYLEEIMKTQREVRRFILRLKEYE